MRYNSFSQFLKNKYGEKIGKLSLDAGFSCPNRDGKLSNLGCVFCSEKGSGDFTSGNLSLFNQIEEQKKINKKKWNNKICRLILRQLLYLGITIIPNTLVVHF